MEYNLQLTKPLSMVDLSGAIVNAEDTVFSIEGWLSGKFQNKKEKYLNEKFGFRTFGVRLNNEIAFDLFEKTKAMGVEVGREKYLYEKEYIKAYLGKDYLGEDKINEQLQKLKFVQDTLQKMGKSMILIFAPGKASFYPEYFPEKYDTVKRGKTNYEVFTKRSNDLGIKFIDFNKYFIENKGKSQHRLYPKFGIHWSLYGACIAGDSLIKYIERDSKIDIPEWYWNEVKVEKARDMDYDLGGGLNLLIQFQRDQMGYPVTLIRTNEKKAKPGLLVVGDSFYFALLQQKFSQCFSNQQFWYYNEEVQWEDNKEPRRKTAAMDLNKEIKNHDIFIIICTERNLSKLGWGYIDRMYNHFAKNGN
jgi:hypothetical protein